MKLQTNGVILSGVEMLDTGIRQVQYVQSDAGLFLVTTTGRGGGLASYERAPDGRWSLRDEAYFTGTLLSNPLEQLVMTDGPEGLMALVGGDNGGLWSFALSADGRFGGQTRLGPEALAEMLRSDDGDGAATGLALQAQLGGLPVPEGIALSAAPLFATVTIGSTAYRLAADSARQAISVHDPDDGARLSTLGADQGLGVAAPTALAQVTLDGKAFVLMAAAGSSSISVMQLDAQGRLTLTDHVIDTLETRFDAVQALEVVQSAGQVFVLAGGGDHGLTLFSLLPDGRLVTRDSLADTAATSLQALSDIDARLTGSMAQIAATSQRDAGVSLLQLDLGDLGQVWRNDSAERRNQLGGSGEDILVAEVSGDTIRGGAGDDVLVAGTGRTILQGGAGRDLFMMRPDSTNARITDFEAGIDRIDLSHWPMLRDPAALQITETSTGARIDYRGLTLSVQASDRETLGSEALFGNRFDWADRLPLPQIAAPVTPLVPPSGLVLRAPQEGTELTGGAGADKLYGGAGADTLTGGAEADLLVGGDGADRLSAGPGDDTLYGNDGDDILQSPAGRNLLSGGNGDDRLTGGTGDDTLRAGRGDDVIMAGAGDDSLRGDSGDDSLYGDDGNDLMRAGSGRNLLSGGTGDDTLYGDRSDDTLHGGTGDDLLVGSSGDDNLYGEGGRDTLYGNNGEDVLRAGTGASFLSGGNDDDRVFGNLLDDTIQGGRGDDLLVGGAGDDSLRGDSGKDTLYGNDGDDLLRAPSSASLLSGGNGSDKLYGGAGSDRLSGGNDDDLIVGGSGHDRTDGGAGDDTLYGNDGADTIEGADGADWASGGRGDDLVFGRSGADTLRGSIGDDRFFGGGDRDVIAGNAGNDTIEGGSDNDRLFGGAGRDQLIGGSGADVLGGGTGADVFVFERVSDSRQGTGTRDRIEDFTPGQDRIDLSELAQGLTFVGATYTGGAGEVRYNEAIGRLYVDLDGDGGSDFAVDLAGDPALGASDLIL